MATSINLRDSVCAQFQETERIENKLNANLISKMNKIALLPNLQEILSKTTQQIVDLQAKSTIAENDAISNESRSKLSVLRQTNIVCDRVYHKCMTAKLSVLKQICKKPHPKIIEQVKNELTLLSANPYLNEREKRTIAALLVEQLGKDLSDVAMDIEKPLALERQLANCPEDILVYLLSFLSVEDLIRLSSCSSFFHRVCQEGSLWKKILQEEYPFLRIPDNKSARETYILQKIGKHNLKNGLYTCSTLIKEAARIWCVEKSENLIFLGLNDNMIKVWDLKDPTNIQSIATLREHENGIVFLHKNGNFLFSASNDDTIKIWDLTDLNNMRCTATLRGHQQSITYLINQDNLLFSASYDMTIKIWDLTKIQCIATLTGHTRAIRCLQKKGNLLFSGSGDHTIKVWDLSNLNNIRCIKTLNNHALSVNCLHINDNILFSGSNDNTIKTWDLSNLNDIRFIETLSVNEIGIRCLKKEHNLLFSGSEISRIKIWDLTTNECIQTLKGHVNGVFYIKKEDNLLFSGSFDNSIKVWNLNVSLEDTLLNLLDVVKDLPQGYPATNQEKMTIFVNRVQGLSLLIRNQIYEEFCQLHPFENKEVVKERFWDMGGSESLNEKRIQAVSRYLLKQVIVLFKKGSSQMAKDLLNKLPQETKNQIYDELNNQLDPDDNSYIGAIEKNLVIPKTDS